MEEKKDIKQWWLYLDGELNEEEQAAFLRKQEEDPALANTFAAAQSLETHLQQLETEMPSMRFDSNVMDNLPALYKEITAGPILGRKSLLRGIFLLITSVLLSLTAAVYGSTSSNSSLYESWQANLEGLPKLPTSTLMAVAVTGFCLVAIFTIDQVLKKRFLHKKI